MQAYCYRLCLTTNADRLAIAPPPDYDAKRYELVARFIAGCVAMGDDMDLRWFSKHDPLPNGKWDFNTATFGGNLPGASWEWPEATYARRVEIAKAHENYHRGLLHFLATDARVPAKVRTEMARFGLPRDEFTDNGGWPHQLYIREARRMVSDLVMIEHHTCGRKIAPQSVGLGSYGTDTHEIRRIVKDGVVAREGKTAGGRDGAPPYAIGYGAIVPKARECENLYVTFALSASHTAFSSIRMEPVFMVVSQSAATAACLALDAEATYARRAPEAGWTDAGLARKREEEKMKPGFIPLHQDTLLKSGLALLALALQLQAADVATAAAMRKPVIVNQAADAVVNYLKLEKRLGQGATKEMVETAMPLLVDQYQGLGVTHIFWNVNYQRVGYRSAVWPSYWDDSDPEKNITSWPRAYYELHKLGIDDLFAVVIPRCREQHISPWVSLRMNDHHYTGNPTCVSELFTKHPELRTNKGKGLWNYTRPEVREFYLKLLVEVLQRYDVDGIELDWVRTPPRFEADERERGRACLTEFVRAARRETLAAAQRRGHPVRLAVRVPDTPEFALGMGFDATGWAHDGLVDMIIPCGWWNGFEDIPIEEWRAALGPAAGKCQIVPGTACTYACTKKGFMMERNMAAMRGFVVAMFDRGADGLYLFNHFAPVTMNIRARKPDGKIFIECTQGDLLRVAGDPAGAVAAPRVHALALHDQIPEKSSYQQPLPATLAPPQSLVFKLYTGPKPATGRYILCVGLDKADDLAAAKLTVRLNGSECRALADMPQPAKPELRLELPRQNTCEVAPRILQFNAPLASVARGYNTVEVTLAQGQKQTVIWLEALLEP
ncbi:MAG: FAD-dependent oxidoreductase [Kiritimatiellaeota bacterium]|nr:FAD-dependent oxidoreductase [Kiritimatiellota bacterium]